MVVRWRWGGARLRDGGSEEGTTPQGSLCVHTSSAAWSRPAPVQDPYARPRWARQLGVFRWGRRDEVVLGCSHEGVCRVKKPLSAMDDEDVRKLLDDKGGELDHELFATVTSTLPEAQQREFQSRAFSIEDPNSELYLEHAVADPEVIRLMEQQALCVDAYSNVEGIATTAHRRQARMKQQLIAAKGDREKTYAHKRGVCKDENYRVFQDFGLEVHDAQCCVYALSFYTGEGSNATSRGASLAVRKGNMVQTHKADVDAYLKLYDHVVYFLATALRCLPYYWGPAVRYVTLSDTAAKAYTPGNIVTWMQYSSSRRGTTAAAAFKGRNCRFEIWSIKGRHIAQFSNYGKSEDEVLFTPFTRLLVLNTTKDSDGNWVIRLREVELGLTKGLPLLWVDDRVLEEDFELKPMMEEAMQLTCRDIKYILKTSTDSAMAYLKSWYGQQVVLNPNFRIISDMSRPDESNGGAAGANLAKAAKSLPHGDKVPCMIFTSNASRGLATLREIAPDVNGVVTGSPQTQRPPVDSVVITHDHDTALAFCSFERGNSKVLDFHYIHQRPDDVRGTLLRKRPTAAREWLDSGAEVMNGEQVIAIRVAGDYTLIRTNTGSEGFVSTRYLHKNGGELEPEPEPA